VETADVVLDSYPPGYLDRLDLGYSSIVNRQSSIVWLSITEFGPDGPWRDYAGSDLVHLALGGEMIMCGYPRNAEGFYDTPPMAGQMGHARHMVGNLAAMHILAAAHFRDRAGLGQRIDLSL